MRASNPGALTEAVISKGDVYSFAIIVQEIVMRKGAFYLGEDLEDINIKGKRYEAFLLIANSA